ncbi:MAG: hypothetical protein JNL01_03090 [Bdellovibrionales bacterium]|nr:hypothetical protein [Bdellovibrionales bacterium]
MPIVAIAGIVFWGLGLWPGLYNLDSFQDFRAGKIGEIREWTSIPYGFWVWILGTTGTALLQALGVCAGLIWIHLKWLRLGVSKRWVFASLGIFLILPLNGVMTFYLTRNTVFSWMLLVTAILPSIWVLQGLKRVPKPWVFAYGAWVSTTAMIRPEAWASVPIAIYAVLRFFPKDRKQNLTRLASGALASVLFFWVLVPALCPIQKAGRVHAMIPILNPLGHFATEGKLTAVEEAVFEKGVDLGALKKSHVAHDIPILQIGGVRESSEAEFSEIRKTYITVVLRNLGSFFENRFSLLWAYLGFSPFTHYFADDLNQTYPFALESRQVLELKPSDSAMRPSVIAFLNTFFSWSALRIFSQALIALLVSITGIFFYKRLPATATACAIELARFTALFLTAPAASFLYSYPLYLFGFFVPTLAWAESRQKRTVNR